MSDDPILKAWAGLKYWTGEKWDYYWAYVFQFGPWQLKWVLGAAVSFGVIWLMVQFFEALETSEEDRSKWIPLEEYRKRIESKPVTIGKITTIKHKNIQERLYELPDKTRVWREVR